jgi:hypothetical protein
MLMSHGNRRLGIAAIVMAALVFGAVAPVAADQPTEAEKARANNPLADVVAFNVQFYLRNNLNGVEDGTANTNWYRLALPTGRWLWRLSAPLETRSFSSYTSSGLGDLDFFGAYNIVQKPGLSFGIGPEATFPTATEDDLGSGKYTLGAAAICFAAPDPKFQTGGLVTWRTDVGGDDDRDPVSLLAIQPFFLWQWGGGVYSRCVPVWVFDLRSGDYSVPLGLGLGKVMKVGDTVFNFFLEPQYTVLVEGIGQPLFQIYTSVNMQF